MSAAVLQGVPVMTVDIDLWIDLPAREYMRVLNIARRLDAALLRNTVVELKDGTLVNFVYEVTGLKRFATELKKATLMSFFGERIPVMRLEEIRKSKEAIRRPKDLVHLEYIAETLKMRDASLQNRDQKKK